MIVIINSRLENSCLLSCQGQVVILMDKKSRDWIYSTASGDGTRICTSVKKHSSYLHGENTKVMKIYGRKLPVGLG